MVVTWYGTAAIGIETEKERILFDPFVPWRGSKVPVRISDFDGFSKILVTHGHFDHIESLPLISRRNPKAVIYATQTPCRTLHKEGIPKNRLKKLSPGKEFRIGDIRIRTWQSRHADLEIGLMDRLSDKRLWEYRCNLAHMIQANLKFKENGEILMYELQAVGKRVLLLGSMNIAEGVNYPDSCDVLVLPYVGYFDNYAAAEKIIRRLGPKKIILSHFDDTFPPMTREVDLSQIQNDRNVMVLVPKHKKPIEI